MSVEAFVIAALIEDGTPRKAFQVGINRDDFSMYPEEWDWMLEQTERGRVVNWRRFQDAFPDFERVQSSERLQDLLDELKRESAYVSLNSALEQAITDLTPDTAMEQADLLREVIVDVLRLHSTSSDVLITSSYEHHLKQLRELQILKEGGQAAGIPTGIKSLDIHWGGLQGGRMVLVLGRPGDAKSMTLSKFLVEAFLDDRRVALFSPEMNEHEHRARIGTLISANHRVQEELGLAKAFRNRALMEGHGFNYKTYKRFLGWLEEQAGEMILFTQKYRRQRITPGFIESRIDDLGLECVIVDPIYKLRGNRRFNDKRAEIEECVDDMQHMAQSFNIPVVISNQANRQGAGTKGEAPSKDTSFNSDAPAQEAAHVIGVKHISEEKKLILRCTKNRFGQDFRVDLKFLPNIGIMDDVSRIDPNYYRGSEDGSDDDGTRQAIEEAEKEVK
jgi:replicative DNA helicase